VNRGTPVSGNIDAEGGVRQQSPNRIAKPSSPDPLWLQSFTGAVVQHSIPLFAILFGVLKCRTQKGRGLFLPTPPPRQAGVLSNPTKERCATFRIRHPPQGLGGSFRSGLQKEAADPSHNSPPGRVGCPHPEGWGAFRSGHLRQLTARKSPTRKVGCFQIWPAELRHIPNPPWRTFRSYLKDLPIPRSTFRSYLKGRLDL
jgi:hypothetical protein